MKKEYSYQVDLTNPQYPRLIRLSVGSIQAFHPAVPGEWEESPYHYAIWCGDGPFMDYDDCTGEEALQYMDIIRENVRKYWARKAAKPDMTLEKKSGFGRF